MKSGCFAGKELLSLLHDIHARGEAGVLHLAHGEDRVIFELADGHWVGSKSRDPEHSLLALLKSAPFVPPMKFKELALALKEKTFSSPWQAVYEVLDLQPEQHQDLFKSQLMIRLRSILDWSKDAKYVWQGASGQGSAKNVKVPHVEVLLTLAPEIPLSKRRNIGQINDWIVALTDKGSELLQGLGAPQPLVKELTGTSKLPWGHRGDRTKLPEELQKQWMQLLAHLEAIDITTKREKAARVAPELERIPELLANAQTQDHFQRLGLSETQSTDEITRAHMSLAKTYHPDRFRGKVDDDLQKSIDSYFGLINESFEVLRRSESRKDYIAALRLEKEGLTQERAQEILRAEGLFQQGLTVLRRGNFKGAVEQFSEAVLLDRDEHEFLLYLGWAKFKLGQQTKNGELKTEGRKQLQKAISNDVRSNQKDYFLAMIEKDFGNLNRCKQLLESCLKAHPDHQEASSELRVITMREEKKGGKRGIFSR